jgi:predicted transposase/invertase (TIGR01784 family)
MVMDDFEIQRRDRAAILEYAVNEATEKGLKDGLEQGLEQGSRQKQLEIAQKLKTIGLPVEQIAVGTGLPLGEIEKL